LVCFGHLDFLCRFDRFKDDFGRFLGTDQFLDTVSGQRMINFHLALFMEHNNCGFFDCGRPKDCG